MNTELKDLENGDALLLQQPGEFANRKLVSFLDFRNQS